jgi:hypothetical protein
VVNQKINIKGTEVIIFSKEKNDYISLTDIARFKDADRTNYIIQNWMRNRSTIEFIGLWEQIHNPNFKSIEFDAFKNEAGSNSFTLTPKRWIEGTNAKGIISKAGRYGGTYAHNDIAFEFASWISAEFKLYLLKEFQRLKQDEFDQQKLEWSVSRILAKVNYRIHTDAIKENLIPKAITQNKIGYVYAGEADLLNIALFGKTAKEWREENLDLKGNMRDHATLEQLIVLSNLESLNAEFIKLNDPSENRLQKLNKIAIEQMNIMLKNIGVKKLSS